MPVCQRLLGYGEFVVALSDEDGDICGKPARFKHTTYDGDVLWLCAGCFDEYEDEFGDGSWGGEGHAAPDEWFENDEGGRVGRGYLKQKKALRMSLMEPLKKYAKQLEEENKALKEDPNSVIGQFIGNFRELYSQNAKLSVLAATLIKRLGDAVVVSKAELGLLQNKQVNIKWEIPDGVKPEDATEYRFTYETKDAPPQGQPVQHTQAPGSARAGRGPSGRAGPGAAVARDLHRGPRGAAEAEDGGHGPAGRRARDGRHGRRAARALVRYSWVKPPQVRPFGAAFLRSDSLVNFRGLGFLSEEVRAWTGTTT